MRPKHDKDILKELETSEFTSKVTLVFSKKSKLNVDIQEGYDSEAKNSVLIPLFTKTIKAYVSDISSKFTTYQQLGFNVIGAKSIITSDKYRQWFENCTKIRIDGIEYEVFSSGKGNNATIEKRPKKLIRIIVQRV